MKKLNTKEFIKRSKEKHGDKYDYSQSVYTTYREPLIVICPIHGEFKPSPDNHMRGMGCRHCGYDNNRTKLDDFIQKANIIHHNKYEYKKVVMTNMNNDVIITCPEHGDFEQRAATHLEGSGCIVCGGRLKLTTENFIEKSSKQHNNKYTYEDAQYVNNRTKISITCPTHGRFEQIAGDHLFGYGCPACSGRLKMTTKQFIINAKKVHGNRYDYTDTIIDGMNNNVDITCSLHGNFKQRPADHQRGVGCPECSLESHSRYNETYFRNHVKEKDRPALVYLVECEIGTILFCKVGITLENISRRFSGKCKIVNILVEEQTTLYDAWKIEQQILKEFSVARFKYQNLKKLQFAGWTECFSTKLKEDITNNMYAIIHK